MSEVLSAAGRLRAALRHQYPHEEIERRRQELAAERCLALLRKSGVLPLKPETLTKLAGAR